MPVVSDTHRSHPILSAALLLAALGACAQPEPAEAEPEPQAVTHAVPDTEYLTSRSPRTPLAPRPEISEVEHFTIYHNPAHYSAHPRQCPFKYLGNDEIILGFTRATTVQGGDSYQDENDVRHGFHKGGYKSRGEILIRRSTDGGRTWPEENDVVVYEHRMPMDQKRAFIFQEGVEREQYDMFHPDSLFYFGRAFFPETHKETALGHMGLIPFAIRSRDNGRTWEKVPTLLEHPFSKEGTLHKDAYPVIRMPDGKTLLGALTLNVDHRGPGVFSSTDNGLTWEFLSRPVHDAREPVMGRFTYANLLQRPTGDLQCYYLHIELGAVVEGLKNAIGLSVSKDGGTTWGEPSPIVGTGSQVWKNPGEKGSRYRSPWPIQLKAGRILVLFARRRAPMGIGGVVSSDDGKTWSHEFSLRDDAVTGDLGYPVGCQLEDGSIFLAYYYTLPDGNGFGGTRFIAGSRFRLN